MAAAPFSDGGEPDAEARAAAIAAMGHRLAAAGRIRPRRNFVASPHQPAWAGVSPSFEDEEEIAPQPIPWRQVAQWSRRAAVIGAAAACGFGIVFAGMSMDLAGRHEHHAPASPGIVARATSLAQSAAAAFRQMVAPPLPAPTPPVIGVRLAAATSPRAASIPPTFLLELGSRETRPANLATPPALDIVAVAQPPMAEPALTPPGQNPAQSSPPLAFSRDEPPPAPPPPAAHRAPRPALFALPHLRAPTERPALPEWRLAETPSVTSRRAPARYDLPRWLTHPPAATRIAAAAPPRRPIILSPPPHFLDAAPPAAALAAAAPAAAATTHMAAADPPRTVPDSDPPPALPPLRERPAMYSDGSPYGRPYYGEPPPGYFGPPPSLGYGGPGYGAYPPGYGGPDGS